MRGSEMMFVKLFVVAFVAGASARSIRSTEQKAGSGENSFSCGCDKRYWGHYVSKGCLPLYEEGNLECPTRFDCPATENNESEEGCVFRGKHYNVGSYLEIDDPCHNCICQGRSGIACVASECFSDGHVPGCYSVYNESSCCSVGTECDAERQPTCSWNNRTYHLGERIYPEEDQCLVCLCTEDWNGPSSRSCRRVDCLTELHEEDLRRGCVPIYHEAACCAIEFHCPEVEQGATEGNASLIEEKDLNKCYFGGKAYSKGEVLDYNHPTGCVTCTCCTPPDITCIHQSYTACQKPSHDDGECHPIHKEGTCCPEYNCTKTSLETIPEETELVTVGPPPDESPCADFKCEEGERCELKEICEETICSIFPKCVPELKSDCPTPQCDTGCYIVHIKDKCPTCACGNSSMHDAAEVCILPNCTGSNCHLISNKDGCPACSCDPPCPVCPPDCQVETDIPEGSCPECICNNISGKNNAKIASCPEPVCNGVNCTMKMGDDNCTHCICLACLPPQCESGCKLTIDESAVCGKCECPTNEELKEEPSANVTVSPTTEVTTGASSTETPTCPELKCRGYNCRILIGKTGCQFCTCESKCPPTKCIPGCFVDPNPLPEQCPGCICHVAALSTDAASNES